MIDIIIFFFCIGLSGFFILGSNELCKNVDDIFLNLIIGMYNVGLYKFDEEL